MKQFEKVAANRVEDGTGTGIVIRNGFSVTYESDGRSVDIARDIIALPDGSTDGSVINLRSSLSWSDGKPVTDAERQEIKADLKIAARLMKTRFVIED